jgi:hypothetical protein
MAWYDVVDEGCASSARVCQPRDLYQRRPQRKNLQTRSRQKARWEAARPIYPSCMRIGQNRLVPSIIHEHQSQPARPTPSIILAQQLHPTHPNESLRHPRMLQLSDDELSTNTNHFSLARNVFCHASTTQPMQQTRTTPHKTIDSDLSPYRDALLVVVDVDQHMHTALVDHQCHLRIRQRVRVMEAPCARYRTRMPRYRTRMPR